MNVDVYILLRFVVIFSEFLSFLFRVLRASPETDPSRRDRSVSVPAELAAETATVNHGTNRYYYCWLSLDLYFKVSPRWIDGSV